MNRKIIGVPEETRGTCIGCMFNSTKKEDAYIGCKDREQMINGEKINCGDSARIYKEVEEEKEDMNEMPKLKSGMIVNYVHKEFGDYGLYLYMNDTWGMSLDGESRQGNTKGIEITEIHELKGDGASSFNFIQGNLKLIWKKKSEKQTKIEALEKTVENALEQIKELKEEA